MIQKNITLQNDTLLWLGDRFYKVEEERKKYHFNSRAEFISKCPCCDDTRKVEILGKDGNKYESECPLCKGSIGKGFGNRITLKNWTVHEYIVHRLYASGPPKASAYKDATECIYSISLTGFCKTGRCMDDYIETRIPWAENINPSLDTKDIKDIEDHYVQDYVFQNKKDAEKLCVMLKEYDKQRLEEFNIKYKTDHKYPF